MRTHKTITLREIANIVMGQSPPGSTYNEQGIGLPFFQGTRDFQYRFPTPRIFCTLPTRIAMEGDILLSVRAPIGKVNVANIKCAIGRGLAIIKPLRESDSRYIEFALRSLESNWHSIEGSGSVFGNATKQDLEQFSIPWPEEYERIRIAHILGTLDDKIDLNRRMNETLEQMARAIFKSWFVDFEPVRAKMSGRWKKGQSLPGLPAHLWDLFPDRLVPSELGEIPDGWKISDLHNVAHFLNGLPLQNYPPKEGKGLPIIKISQLHSMNFLGADLASADIDPDFIVNNGDIIFSWSGSLECVLWTGGKGALNQHLFKVSSQSFPVWLVYFWIHQHLPAFREIAAGKATTMGHIQRHHLEEAKIISPPNFIMEKADELISPLWVKLIQQSYENSILSLLRNILLPKLISGQIDLDNFRISGEI